MGVFLQLVALLWGGIGAYYIYLVASDAGASDMAIGLAIIMAAIISFIPALVLAGIGSLINKRSDSQASD